MTQPIVLIGEDGCASLCAIAEKCPEGCFVEFGVYQGGSALRLAELAQMQGREIYLYDTFEGIPFKSEIDVHHIGDFADTSYDAVCKLIPYAHVIKGVFPQSIVPMPKIAFAHIDSDQYDSVKSAIDYLGPLMVDGGVMVFDDVWCLDGATKALMDSGLEFSKTDRGKAMVRFYGLEN